MNSEPLDELREAVQNDNEADVVRLSRRVTESFANYSRLVKRHQDLAYALGHGAEPDSDVIGVAEEYLETATDINERRSAVNRSLLEYLAGEASREDVLSEISAFESKADAEVENRSTLLDHRSEFDVSPILDLDVEMRASEPKGREITKEVTLSNIGGDRTAEIEISTDGDLPFESTVDTIDALSADETISFSVEAQAIEAGEFELVVSARGEETSTSDSGWIAVLPKTDYLERAQAELQRNEVILEEYLDDERNENNQRGGRHRSDLQNAVAKLEIALKRIETALHVLDESNNTRPADSNIETAAKKVGEFLDHVEETDSEKMKTEGQTELFRNALDAKRNLDLAFEADP